MKTYCGADCESCVYQGKCQGCRETCGSPFGGKCIAAEYVKTGGIEAYRTFKEMLRQEINELLTGNGIPMTDALYELVGESVNLEYPLPSGETVKFLGDRDIYLGAQIEFADQGICYGVIADSTFILVCSYSVNGSEPELILYQRR